MEMIDLQSSISTSLTRTQERLTDIACMIKANRLVGLHEEISEISGNLSPVQRKMILLHGLYSLLKPIYYDIGVSEITAVEEDRLTALQEYYV